MVKVKEDMTGWKMWEHGVPDSRWIVMYQTADYVRPNGTRDARWHCMCSCDKHTEKDIISADLRKGHNKSCGCLGKETILIMHRKKSEQAEKHACDNVNVAKYFFAESELNKGIDLTKITEYSGRHIHCRCPICGFFEYDDGKPWMPPISSISVGHGCPACWQGQKSSFPEQALYYYLNKVTNAENRFIGFGKEIDIWLPTLNVGIEYNGSFWHKNLVDKSDKDQKKIEFLKDKGIRIIIVTDGDKNIVGDNMITHIYKDMDWMINEVFKMVDLPNIDINTNRDEQLIYQQYLTYRKENSFASLYPDKIKEWDYIKNKSITPDMVDPGSHKRFWRICPICKKSYLTSVLSWKNSKSCKECYNKESGGKNKKPTILIDAKGNIVNEFSSAKEASQYLGISVSHLCGCVLKTHKFFIASPYKDYELWYKDEYNKTKKIP